MKSIILLFILPIYFGAITAAAGVSYFSADTFWFAVAINIPACVVCAIAAFGE